MSQEYGKCASDAVQSIASGGDMQDANNKFEDCLAAGSEPPSCKVCEVFKDQPCLEGGDRDENGVCGSYASLHELCSDACSENGVGGGSGSSGSSGPEMSIDEGGEAGTDGGDGASAGGKAQEYQGGGVSGSSSRNVLFTED